MLLQVYDYVVSRREELLRGIHGAEPTLERARSMWNSYEPRRREGLRVAGIDSSWNSLPYLGFHVYVVDAVCLTADEEHVVPPRYEAGVGTLSASDGERVIYNPRLVLEGIGMDFERQLALEASGTCDRVLVDGSVMARYYDRRSGVQADLYMAAKELMGKRNIVFVSKRSDSNSLLGGAMGDIHYFNGSGTSAGYSEPHMDKESGVSIFYARLSRDMPCLRVEVPGDLGEGEQRELMDVLWTDSIDGYPVQLRLAHEACKVSREDVESVADLLGLSSESGGREVLGE